MKTHKRGVENVIHFQSLASVKVFDSSYYLHWNDKTEVNRFENLICIGIKKNLFWFITLNLIIFKVRKKKKRLFIHSHNPLMSVLCFFKSDVLTVHDALYYLTSNSKHKLKGIFWGLEKILYLRCRFVHFISEYAKEMSLYPRNNKSYVIIPNTSHFESFTKTNISGDLRKFKAGVLKVFTVRSIEERALINLIIDVSNELKNEPIEFLIAGKGPLLDFYRALIKSLKLKNVTLLGYVSDNDMISYYDECDLVLIPAKYGEGFGLPIIEGYLFNKPVISSNVCAIPDVIISKEFLFENNLESIIAKLRYAALNKDYKFKKYYDDHFSNNKIILKMNELYVNLM